MKLGMQFVIFVLRLSGLGLDEVVAWKIKDFN